MSKLNKPEPPPVKNDLPYIGDLVIADIKDRMVAGEKKYGTKLQPFNGRDPLVDAYQEAMDLTIYLRQVIEERARRAVGSAAVLKAAKQLPWEPITALIQAQGAGRALAQVEEFCAMLKEAVE